MRGTRFRTVKIIENESTKELKGINFEIYYNIKIMTCKKVESKFNETFQLQEYISVVIIKYLHVLKIFLNTTEITLDFLMTLFCMVFCMKIINALLPLKSSIMREFSNKLF